MATTNEDKPTSEMIELTTSVSGDQTRQHDAAKRLPLGQAIRKYPRIVGYIMGLILGILLVGYDTVIVGTISALPRFQQDFGTFHNSSWIIPATWLSAWSASSPIGSVCGGLTGGWLADRVGRRWTLAIGSAISATAVAIIFTSNLSDDVDARRGVFLLGKIMQGFSLGIINQTSQTYVSETVPVALRGSAMALFPTSILLGQLTGAVVIFTSSGYDSVRQYLIPFGSQWPFSAVPMIMALVMPESPAYLVTNEKLDQAFKSIQRLHTSKVDLQAELGRFKRSIEHEKEIAAEATYVDCFKGCNLRRTGIVAFASTLPILFGLPLLAQASYFVQTVGMGADNSLIFLILGIGLGLIANGVGVWIMSRIGRRLSSIVTLSVTTVLWAGMGIAGCWNGVVTIWWTAVTMMLVVVTCGLGVWPASTTIGAEVSALNLRAKSLGIGVFAQDGTHLIFNLVLPYIFNPDAGNLRAKTGFVYGGVCLIATVTTWKIVPELKDRSMIEIDRMFELKVPTNSFKNWRDDGGGSRQDGRDLQQKDGA